jgi:hypothetical protein
MVFALVQATTSRCYASKTRCFAAAGSRQPQIKQQQPDAEHEADARAQKFRFCARSAEFFKRILV